MSTSEHRSVSERALATYGLAGAPLEDLRVEAPRRLSLDRAAAYRSIFVAAGQTLELAGGGALIASALTVEAGARVVFEADLVGYFDTVRLADTSTPNIVNIGSNGADGRDGASGAPPYPGGNGSAGAAGSDCFAVKLNMGSLVGPLVVLAGGGRGGNGGNGGSGGSGGNGGAGGNGGNGQPTVVVLSSLAPVVSLQVIPNDNNGGLGGVGGSPSGISGASGTAGSAATVTLTTAS